MVRSLRQTYRTTHGYNNFANNIAIYTSGKQSLFIYSTVLNL